MANMYEIRNLKKTDKHYFSTSKILIERELHRITPLYKVQVFKPFSLIKCLTGRIQFTDIFSSAG